MALKMALSSPLIQILAAQKSGQSKGISSICSANPFVIEAVLHHASLTNEPVLIESTCNQVNQFGGYMGWTPAEFSAYLRELAGRLDFPFEGIIVGGDHLGPGPWQHEPTALAMTKGKELVRQCVSAGYSKIHLDASMKCADDDPNQSLDLDLSAGRTAELAQAAEAAYIESSGKREPPLYVIGTEVPLPGGAHGQDEKLVLTGPADVAATIEATRKAFQHHGLERAWQRVVAVVVQPGVEYGDVALSEYDRMRAAGLVIFIESIDRLIYEAHSTDFQTAVALRQMVEDHFAILKVGPALTFAFREAVFALAAIEEALLADRSEGNPSQLRQVLEKAMLANPIYWQDYYQGSAQSQEMARQYSFSDRSRYYWPVPEVQRALNNLLRNLEAQQLPLTLLSQFLPVQYRHIRNGQLANAPRPIIIDKIREVLAAYSFACGYLPTGTL